MLPELLAYKNARQSSVPIVIYNHVIRKYRRQKIQNITMNPILWQRSRNFVISYYLQMCNDTTAYTNNNRNCCRDIQSNASICKI